MDKLKLHELLTLFKKVNSEFDRLSLLDSPESVNPNDRIWDEVLEVINDLEEEVS